MTRFLAFALLAPALFAQIAEHAPDGNSFLRVVSIAVPPKAGAPFTATVTTHLTRMTADGSTTATMNRRAIARDSLGRVLQERRTFVSANGSLSDSHILQFDIEDPVAHVRYVCDPFHKTCDEYAYNMRAEPSEFESSNGFRVEDLGATSFAGMSVTGTRQTKMIPAGAIGNDRALAITKEIWFSRELGVNLHVVRDDPRNGHQEFSVGDIHLGEPSARLFEVPSGYKVLDHRE